MNVAPLFTHFQPSEKYLNRAVLWNARIVLYSRKEHFMKGNIMSGIWREDENGDIVPVPSTVVMHPMVGIFWFIEMGKDDDFVYDAVPISQGEKYDDAIAYGEHYSFWKKHLPKTCTEVIFKDNAYDAYPRGRIVFLPNENKFVIYIDKCICTDDLVKIIEKFQIDNVDIAIEEDEQYRCTQCKSLFINC